MSRGREPSAAVMGLGAVSSFGAGAEPLWEGVLRGLTASSASPLSARGIETPRIAATLGDRIAALIEKEVDPRFLRRLADISRTSVAAAVLSLKSAGGGGRTDAMGEDALRDATAVILGTCYGASRYHFDYYEKVHRGRLKDASPLLFSESVMNAAPGHISIYLRLRGATLALAGGEEVGLMAVADAADRIRLGDAAAALAGGAEEYCDFVHAALGSRGIVSGDVGEPWSGSARGTFLAEGAAILFLEDARGIARRGAAPLALVAGVGAARSEQKLEGAAGAVERAVSLALEEAGADAADVGLAVTSASGGPHDLAEAAGIARALGASGSPARQPIVLAAPKSALGEGFAFTSAAAALVAVKALAEGTAPPTAALASRPPGLPPGLRVLREPEPLRCGHALAVATSRLGNAVAVLFRRR